MSSPAAINIDRNMLRMLVQATFLRVRDAPLRMIVMEEVTARAFQPACGRKARIRSLVRLVVVRLNVAAVKRSGGRNAPPGDRDAVDRDIRLIRRCPGFLTVVDENQRN